jgi:hypothetical protein
MTAHDFIKAAMRLNGSLDPGRAPTASESADGLEALQALFDGLSAQGLLIYANTSESLTLTGATSYTIGSAGTFNTVRPEKVVGAYVSGSGLDYIMVIIDARKYREIGQKSTSGTPAWLYYSPEYPLGKIYVHPAGTGTLNLESIKPLTEPTALTTTIALPPGYKQMIKYNLALEMAPEFGVEVSPAIAKIAVDSLNNLMSKNASARVETVNIEIEKLSHNRGRRWSIDAG